MTRHVAHPVMTSVGRRITHPLPAAVASDARELARELSAPLSEVLYAVFAALLHRHTGAQDLLIGITSQERPLPEFQDLIGCCENHSVRRTDLSGEPSIRELVRRTMAEEQATRDQRSLALDDLLSQLEALDV